MNTYAKLKNGRLMIVWSDNTEEETMLGYPANKEDDFDIEFETLEKWNYDDIIVTGTNRFNVERQATDKAKQENKTECSICQNQVYYQPAKDEIDKTTMFSFQVFANLKLAKTTFPEVKHWIEYQGDAIEEPQFLDCPNQHQENIV